MIEQGGREELGEGNMIKYSVCKTFFFNGKKKLCLGFQELILRPASVVSTTTHLPIWQLMRSGGGSAEKEAKERERWPELS